MINQIALNRRYKKLQELIDGDDYFSEERIRMRDVLNLFLISLYSTFYMLDNTKGMVIRKPLKCLHCPIF